ncbi:MAG: hypothetical protein DYG98_19710 [Haliscomenobacteraceae bacterium CHB4]|nr:hypothetical protein [Saprospiraceae bacterium]MCE7925289.1 hypothetical protein [Haliscomenobacteraceae bacterium CHB4]
MKKAIFLLSFFFALGIATANAQSCHSAAATKSCCASKASKAASSDASIEKRQAEDGTVSYVRKETDAQGNVKFVSVQYDESTNTFVNAAPKSATIAEEDKATATKKAAACSPSEKKACAGAAGSGKACCASKAAKASTTAAPEQK